MLIKKRESTRLKYLNDSKVFIEYSNDIEDIYKYTAEYNPNKKHKTLIVFDDIITDKLVDKKPNPIVTELFVRGKKLNIFLVFIIQLYFDVPKKIRLNYTRYFNLKIPNKQELHQIVFNYSSDIDFKDFMNINK